MTPAAAQWWAGDLRAVFPGVYVTGWAPLTQTQTWMGATLTAPRTSLAAHAAASAHGLVAGYDGEAVSVVRPGQCGVERTNRLVVRYSATLGGHVVTVDGLRLTDVERTIIDLWPMLRSHRERRRMVREALRTRATTPRRLLAAIREHRGSRGVASLRAFVEHYAHLPFSRCRSDAEAYALTVLDDAGIEIPMVNTRHAGEEADFCWFHLRRILEIDGPQWHRFADVDARKTAAWRQRASLSTACRALTSMRDRQRCSPSPQHPPDRRGSQGERGFLPARTMRNPRSPLVGDRPPTAAYHAVPTRQPANVRVQCTNLPRHGAEDRSGACCRMCRDRDAGGVGPGIR